LFTDYKQLQASNYLSHAMRGVYSGEVDKVPKFSDQEGGGHHRGGSHSKRLLI
jgi:hypothetical protein